MILRQIKASFRFIGNLKLVHKLLLSYIILIFIPLVLISWLFYKNFSRFATNHVTYSTKQSFEQAYSFLSYKLNNVKETSNVLLRNNNIMNIIKTDLYSGDDVHQMESMNSLLTFLTSLQNETNVARVRLYVPNGLLYSNDNRNIFNINSIKDTEWYNILKKGGKSFFWSPSSALGPDDPSTQIVEFNKIFNKDVLSLTKLLLDPEKYSESIAAVRFDFYKSDVVKILNKANTFANSLTYIENSQGELVATSSDILLQKYRVKDFSAENLSDKASHWTTYHSISTYRI